MTSNSSRYVLITHKVDAPDLIEYMRDIQYVLGLGLEPSFGLEPDIELHFSIHETPFFMIPSKPFVAQAVKGLRESNVHMLFSQHGQIFLHQGIVIWLGIVIVSRTMNVTILHAFRIFGCSSSHRKSTAS